MQIDNIQTFQPPTYVTSKPITTMSNEQCICHNGLLYYREQMKAQKSVRLEAEKMAEENKAQPRIYTADMKAAGFYDDNDVSIIDDDNALKFNQDGSSNRLNIS